jgi:hypothetical protein
VTFSRYLVSAIAAVSVLLAGCTAETTAAVTSTPAAAAAPPAVPVDPAGQGAGDPDTTAPTTPAIGSTKATPAALDVTTTVVPLTAGVADEVSGMAAATGAPGVYFLVDDATGTDTVVAVRADGALLARIGVAGMSADNAEAMASGTCGPLPLPAGTPDAQTCLYVGDIGDNAARRADIAVFRFAEPDLADVPDESVAADEWRYTYPDGPRNAEAMLLNPDGSLLVVTKPAAAGNLSHRMYRGAPGGGELVLVREFRPPDVERPLRTLLTGNVITDLAASPGRVLLLTYDEVREFTAPTPDADVATFPDWPQRRLPMPWLTQAEAVTGAANGCGYAVASEAGPGGGPGSLAMMDCS